MADETPVKVPKTNGQRVMYNIRVALHELKATGWTADPKADYYLAEADVLATLELADAIRAGSPA
jgi:hypothetical protein